MNRDILFRGKRLSDRKWIIGDYSIRGGQACIGFDSPCTPLRDAYRVDAFTVGQYTGLKDKHGRKIFENDRWLCDIDDGLPTKGHVRWWGDGWVIVHDDDNGELHLPLIEIHCDLEITGNIYDGDER